MLVVDAFLTLEPEFANILPLKELLDLPVLELFEVEGRETIDRLDELLRVTLELLLVEGLEELILELLLVEDVEELILALLVEGLGALTVELLLVEGLEVLTLELLLLEGLEVLTLELVLVEGLEVLTLELEDLEEPEDLEGLDDLEEEELLEADLLPPLDLLLLERDDLAITEPVINIKAKTIENRIALRFFDCFRVNMACLLIF